MPEKGKGQKNWTSDSKNKRLAMTRISKNVQILKYVY